MLSFFLLVAPAYAAYCGTSTIPYSFEVLPDGSTSLGCARPTCFGWNPYTGNWAAQDHTFINEGGRQDGFLRPAVLQRPPFNASTTGPPTATCSISSSCRYDQWAAGFFRTVNGVPGTLWCCSYPTLATAEDQGTSVLHNGQITIGGEVEIGGRTAFFDYIRNIQPIRGSLGQVVGYYVDMGRMRCVDPLSNIGAPPPQLADSVIVPSSNAVPSPSYQPGPSSSGCCQSYYYPVQSFFCFAADSLVRLADGTEKRMDELKVSDRVTIPTEDMKNVSLSSVHSWLHRVADEEADFIVLSTSTGREIKLTAKHFIYKADDCTKPNDFKMVTADQVNVTDCVYSMDLNYNLRPTRVVGRRIAKQKGIFAPLTLDGKIIVDGIAASCHSNVGSDAVVQTLHKNFVECDPNDVTCSLKTTGFNLALDMVRLTVPLSFSSWSDNLI